MNIGTDIGSARRDDPPTAVEAAKRVRPGSARFALLDAHATHPTGLTDEEAATKAGLSLTSEYATRCSELTREGLLTATGETRPGSAGVDREVRRITTHGRHALAVARDVSPLKPDPNGPRVKLRLEFGMELCRDCQGTGGTNAVACARCEGKGRIR